MFEKQISVPYAGLRAALILVFGFVLTLAGAALPASASGYGSISGSAYLPGGAASANAEVCLFAEPSAGWSSECVVANSNGGFAFSGLAPGSYSLSASASGYVTTYFGDHPYLKDRTVFELSGGQLSGKDLHLLNGTTITGKVVDSAGHPFAYDLTLSLRGPAEDPKPGDDLRPGTPTDGTKPYSFGPVADGTYRVVAESTVTCTPQQDEACQWAEATVVVAGGRTVTASVLRLAGGTGFAGTVSFPVAVGPDQAPSRLYQLDVYNRSGTLVRSGVYEAATPKGTTLVGRYQLHLDPGRYQLRFTPVGGSAIYCLGCAGGLSTKTGRLLTLSAIALAGPVKALSTGGVRVDGSAMVGQTVTAATVGWPDGAQLHYQWLRNGHKIKGATGASRVLTARDLHARISVRVRASLERATSVQVTAKLATRVSRGELSGGTAAITGTPLVSQRLTAISAGWQPSAVHSHYRWLRDGKPIRRATGKSFRVRAADRGHQLSVQITAYRSGFHSAKVTSAALTIS